MPTTWWLDALKRIEKIIRENAFEQKKKKPRSKINPGLALIGFEQLGLDWSTLGARDFSSAVSGFCQVFIVTRANTENSHRTRQKPLVPRVWLVALRGKLSLTKQKY